ncbi:NAD(P)/FAD-dependent oxidoreductase [Naasia sp. SYSU D00057]|uniref:NAD(P)/FAD-dependent oxidoreductase n=1 Tax=Naasia sp. SYSU D00057 TaxID=2817380 RepID=UPI001B30185B|nr:FAD/NAD(P)-binding oxidoreductase [Naasia sp. SYSU D00057]
MSVACGDGHSSHLPADSVTAHRVVVVGGGNAGLSVAGRLARYGVDDIVVIEPREHHRYQPIFSHVAGGTARASQAERRQADVIPRGVQWIQAAVTEIDPETDTVRLDSGDAITYEHLIVCPGIQNDFHSIPGLEEAIRTGSASSHYEFELVATASRRLRDLRSGTVVFTQPPGPASCAGAAQKPMYLACDYWRATGVLPDIRVVFVVPTPTMFGMPAIDEELERKVEEYGIEVRHEARLVEVDATSVLIGSVSGDRTERIAYDYLHVVPPQSAPDFLKGSPLAAADDPGGFVEVDPRTLRHRRYANVWSLGDAAATTNSKSGGALRKQTKVLALNLVATLKGREPDERYDGYSVCPFTVSRRTMVFAEFDDEYRPKPTVPFWPGLARERRSTWLIDRYVLPWVYWHLILQGRA